MPYKMTLILLYVSSSVAIDPRGNAKPAFLGPIRVSSTGFWLAESS
jgi:hypothetical protein